MCPNARFMSLAVSMRAWAAGNAVAKPWEVELIEVEVRSGGAPPGPAGEQASRLETDTRCPRDRHASDSALPEAVDNAYSGDSETVHLLEGLPVSDSQSVRQLPGLAAQWEGQASGAPYTASDTVWYRQTPVLLALVAASLNGLCFAFLDEVGGNAAFSGHKLGVIPPHLSTTGACTVACACYHTFPL